MTDKKALEVLKSWLQLAYQNADGTDECCAELYEALQTVFALINRQQAENKELSEAIHNLTIEKDALFDKAEELKAKIERLQKEANLVSIQFQDLQERTDEIKAEAYKEFAARLKCGVPQETGVIRCSDVDNLVKEMVGDEK